MRVWQPGGHLTRNREAVQIDDWSWQRTVRRVTTGSTSFDDCRWQSFDAAAIA